MNRPVERTETKFDHSEWADVGWSNEALRDQVWSRLRTQLGRSLLYAGDIIRGGALAFTEGEDAALRGVPIAALGCLDDRRESFVFGVRQLAFGALVFDLFGDTIEPLVILR